MAVADLYDLFKQELSDMHNAEKQLTKALPKLAAAAADSQLAQAFENHLQETQEHVTRLEEVARLCDIKIKRKKCEAIEGLINEGSGLIQDMEEGLLRDAALISAAQKVEHYEISGYLSLLKLAENLGYRQALPLLLETLEEEEEADETLSDIGDDSIEECVWLTRSATPQPQRISK